jgi:membrane-bound ClpP family serine protease
MNVSKTVRELLLGVLGGTGCILILLGIQALSNKGNWIIFMVGGVLLLVGSLFIASKSKEPVNRP